MSKYRLILKSGDTKIKPHKRHLEFFKDGKGYVTSYKHLEGVYIDQNLSLPLRYLVKLAKKVPVYLIDRYGYIKATLTLG